MGVLSGTLSYMRYFVEGQPPDDLNAFVERLQLYATPELTPDHEEEQVTGWAIVDRVLETEFRREAVIHNEYALFCLRIDSWKIPGPLLKAYQTAAERNYMLEHNREKLGKRERSQIKEVVRKDLKSKLLPSLAAYDVCWHIDKGLIRFWSLSSKANEAFIELFEKTFGLHLVPQTPYTLAERFGLDEEQLAEMAKLEPQTFASPEE